MGKGAERIAGLCYKRLRTGISVEDAESFRQQLYCDVIRGVADVPDDSASWHICHGGFAQGSVSFSYHIHGDIKRTPFQTTVIAAGGILQAERVARLCYEKFRDGANKEDVLRLRQELYTEIQLRKEKAV